MWGGLGWVVGLLEFDILTTQVGTHPAMVIAGWVPTCELSWLRHWVVVGLVVDGRLHPGATHMVMSAWVLTCELSWLRHWVVVGLLALVLLNPGIA